MKITSESNTIERRDDGPVTRVVPRFMIVPNFLSGAFLIERAHYEAQARKCAAKANQLKRGKK